MTQRTTSTFRYLFYSITLSAKCKFFCSMCGCFRSNDDLHSKLVEGNKRFVADTGVVPEIAILWQMSLVT